MIIFLYGQDNYRSRQKLKELIEHYKKIHKTVVSLKYIDVRKLSFKDLEDELKHINKSIPILKRELECEKYLEALDMVLENTPFSRKKQETFLN